MELNNHCHPETLTRISKFTLFIKKFNPQLPHTDSHTSPQLSGSLCITVREGKNNVIASESEAIQTMVINNNKTNKEG